MPAEDLLRQLATLLDVTPAGEALAAFRGFKAAHPQDQHELLEIGFSLYAAGQLVLAAERLIVVALIHGIRTAAGWQEKAREALAVEGKVVVAPIGYGYQDAIRFLGPWRQTAIAKVQQELRDLQRIHKDSDLVVMAHSFGTYIISKILQDSPDIRIKRLLLCGSIIPIAYRWDSLSHDFTNQNCVNEVGTRDIWPVFARVASFGYGESGSFGFKTSRVWDRFFDYGHSDFFTDDHFKKFWQPFILNGQVVASPWDAKRPTPSWLVSVLGGVPMVKGLVMLLALGMVGWLVYWASKAALTTLLGGGPH
jgi:pimeloyl-ACP methyl ester carboxylesterase